MCFYHYVQNSSNFEVFECFSCHYLGQILANIDFHAYTWPEMRWPHIFVPGKIFWNVNWSIWPIYKVMNVHLLKSMKYALKMEFWVDFRSWKMKIFCVFWPNVGQNAFLMLAHVEKLSEIVFGCSLISRTMSRTCFGQDLAKKHQISS